MSQGVRVVRTDLSTGGLPTSTSTSGISSSGPLDRGYAGSCPGILKVAQMLTLLIGFICVRCSRWTDYRVYNFFEIITMCDFVMILIFYIVYIFRAYRVLSCINWPLAEFLHYLIGTLLLLIASIVAVAKSYGLAGLVAGSIFGFFATVLCILSIWLSYKVSCVTQSTDAAV